VSTVLLTGASGFLGVHTVRALRDAGHTVRALARAPDRLLAHLADVGVGADDPGLEVVVGDMTDAGVVRDAVVGCEGVVHAAATFSYRRADSRRMREENLLGTATVLDAGIEAGCRTVVHVSSTVALHRPGAVHDHRSPLGTGVGPYTTSKVESERAARERQDAGAPVTIVNPGAIIGPHDPNLGESNQVVRDVLAGRVPVWPRGGFQFVDVRDCAAVLVGALSHPGGRYLVPGESVPDLHGPLSEVTGRRLKVLRLPVGVIVPTLLPGYLTGWSFLPHAVEGARYAASGISVDADMTRVELGVAGRPLRDSLRDTVRWMVTAGHLTAKQAGDAAR